MDLPIDIWILIFEKLHWKEKINARITCKLFSEILFDIVKFEKIIFTSNITKNFHWFKNLYVYDDLNTINNFKHLETLEFNNSFNKPIDEPILLKKLKFLQFGNGFNQIIGENILPKNLEILHFGFGFNKPIRENVLPKNLRKIDFGFKFNQPISENVLPEKLEVLDFGYSYNQPITIESLPKSLRKICLSRNYKFELILPDTIEVIWY